MTGVKRLRLDLALVDRQLAPSRDKAKAMIMAGDVLVNGQIEWKADRAVLEADLLEIKQKYPYVSRGAFKLEAAVRSFSMQIENKRILDVGVSTGGFCDYLLQHGARGVIGLDVNVRQVADPVRTDPRVTLIEKNVKFLEADDLIYSPDWVVIDLSFISILRALAVLTFLGDVPILGMVKPQFESPKGQIGKGGILRDVRKVEKILLNLMESAREMGYGVQGIAPAGIKGKKGNQEYFLLFRYGLSSTIDDKMVNHVITSV